MEIKINDDIKLREITLADAEDLFEFASDPVVTKYLRYDYHKNLEETRDIIKNIFLKNDDPLSKLVIEYKDKMIGMCNLVHNQGLNEIGYQLNKKYWGKRIIPTVLPYLIDVFFMLHPDEKIYITADPKNVKSLKIIDKLNFIKSDVISDQGINYLYTDKERWDNN